METKPPPPVIGSARVMAYAVVEDSVVFTGRNALYVGGELLGRVPRLVIARNLVEAGFDTPMFFHCDDEWNVLGSVGGECVEALKEYGERNYNGISTAWIHLDTTIEAALEYYDREVGECCSFCGRRDFDVARLIKSPTASICDSCVALLHSEFVGNQTE